MLRTERPMAMRRERARSDRASPSNDTIDNQHYRHDQQNVDQTTNDIESKASQPQQKQNSDNRPDHDASLQQSPIA
jgi:hypothetical protein